MFKEVNFLLKNPGYDYRIPVIVQVDIGSLSLLSLDVKAILQSPALQLVPLVDGVSGRLTAVEIFILAQSNLVSYMTLDALLRPTSSLLSNSIPTENSF